MKTAADYVFEWDVCRACEHEARDMVRAVQIDTLRFALDCAQLATPGPRRTIAARIAELEKEGTP